MRRSALALGGTVMALALTAGSAAAQSVGGQAVTGLTGAAHAGPTPVAPPVPLPTGADLTGGGSAGAQAGPAGENVPIPVGSDGHDATTSGSGPTDQSPSDPGGAAQVGPAETNAPAGAPSDGGTATQGLPADPIIGLVQSGVDALDGLVDSLAASTPPLAVARTGGAGSRDPDRFGNGSAISASFASAPAGLDAANVTATLPFTGLGVLRLLLLGLLFLASGIAVRRGSVATG